MFLSYYPIKPSYLLTELVTDMYVGILVQVCYSTIYDIFTEEPFPLPSLYVTRL